MSQDLEALLQHGSNERNIVFRTALYMNTVYQENLHRCPLKSWSKKKKKKPKHPKHVDFTDLGEPELML